MKWSAVCAEQAAGHKPGDPVFTAWARLAVTPVREVKALVITRDDRPGRRGGRRGGPRRDERDVPARGRGGAGGSPAPRPRRLVPQPHPHHPRERAGQQQAGARRGAQGRARREARGRPGAPQAARLLEWLTPAGSTAGSRWSPERSGGIGRRIAAATRRRGRRPWHSPTDPTPSPPQDLASEIASNGGRAIAIGADLRDAGDTERLADTTDMALGPIDLLVAERRHRQPRRLRRGRRRRSSTRRSPSTSARRSCSPAASCPACASAATAASCSPRRSPRSPAASSAPLRRLQGRPARPHAPPGGAGRLRRRHGQRDRTRADRGHRPAPRRPARARPAHPRRPARAAGRGRATSRSRSSTTAT